MVAFILKAVDITTHYRPTIAGLSARDFLYASAISLLFALALAARTWVKANEPRMLRERWRRLQEEPEAFHGWNGEGARGGGEARSAAVAEPVLEVDDPPAVTRLRTPSSSL
jgi:hypothetical protein